MEHKKISDLLKQVETDSETFRAEAMGALKDFTPDDRDYIKQLRCDSTDIDKVLQTWETKLRPERERLLAKRIDRVFRATLKRNLGFSDEHAREEIEYMVDERLEQLLDETVDNLYPLEEGDPPHSLASQRAYALYFLAQSDEEIEDFKYRYEAYSNYIRVAHAHAITLCDPHASWLERQRCSMQIRREREQTREEEETRLMTIESELIELGKLHDGLVAEVMHKRWDYIKMSDLRQKYEKRVDALTERQSTPTKKLKIFDDVVRTFREHEVERAVQELKKPNLETVRQIGDAIDSLLLRFFELKNKDKNELLLALKQYRTLIQEQDMITMIRKNRAAFEKRQTQMA